MISKNFFKNLIIKQLKNLDRQKIREENILSMKSEANDIDLKDTERFDSFCSVIFSFLLKLFNIVEIFIKAEIFLCS